MRSLALLTTTLTVLTSLHAGSPVIDQALSAPGKNPAASEVLPESHSGWSISAGAQYRTLGDAAFFNSSRSPGYLAPLLIQRAGSGGSSGGSYADGFVDSDISGSAVSSWNWGYTSASQVQGNTITFHGSGGGTSIRSESQWHDADWADRMSGWGGYVDFQSPELMKLGGVRLSALLGYSLTRADLSQGALAYTATRHVTVGGGTFTDVYEALGAIPGAPYTGSFAGPGTVINLVPISSTGSSGGGNGQTTVEHYRSYIHNDLDVNLHTFSFGPRLLCQTVLPRLQLGSSLGLAMNVASWDASTQETLSRDGSQLRSWRSQRSGTKVLPGFFLEATANYQINKKWSATSSVRYDWSRSLKGSTGASDFSVDLSGVTVKVGLTMRF